MTATTALFIIDIQNDLATDPKTKIPHAGRVRAAGDEILSAARRVLDAQHSSNPQARPHPILFFVQHHEKPEEGPLVRGSDAWKLVFEPRRESHLEVVVHKTTRKS